MKVWWHQPKQHSLFQKVTWSYLVKACCCIAVTLPSHYTLHMKEWHLEKGFIIWQYVWWDRSNHLLLKLIKYLLTNGNLWQTGQGAKWLMIMWNCVTCWTYVVFAFVVKLNFIFITLVPLSNKTPGRQVVKKIPFTDWTIWPLLFWTKICSLSIYLWISNIYKCVFTK